MEQIGKNTLPAEGKKGEIILYQPNANICIEVRLEDETVWLTQLQMAELFNVNIPAISKHIKNIFIEGELELSSTVSKMEIVRKEGNRVVRRIVDFYNLDVIISVGYRVKSQAGTRFRQWAAGVLRQYMLKGYIVHPSLQQVEYHLTKQIEGQREELYRLQQQVQHHQQQIDFLIRREQPVTEQLFSTGCVWDAYTFVSDLVRSAEKKTYTHRPICRRTDTAAFR